MADAPSRPSVPREVRVGVEAIEDWHKLPLVWAALGPEKCGRLEDALEEIRHILTMYEGPVYPR